MESIIFYTLAGFIGGVAAAYFTAKKYKEKLKVLDEKRSEYLAKYNHANLTCASLKKEIDKLKGALKQKSSKNGSSKKPAAKRYYGNKKSTRKRTTAKK